MHSREVFHFDIKLENIMIDGPLELSCSNSWVKIVDFGACQQLCESQGGLFTSLQGTPGYIAPEVYKNKPYAGGPVDVFALAQCLFIMILGRYAFTEAISKKDGRFKKLKKG